MTFQTTQSMIILQQYNYIHKRILLTFGKVNHQKENKEIVFTERMGLAELSIIIGSQIQQIMLSIEKATELEVVGTIPDRLVAPTFVQAKPLWIKENKITSINTKQINYKRYQFVKIGRTFGFETTRYLSFHKGFLLYYDDQTSSQFKGYCKIQNVYLQWFTVKSGRHLLYLSNGNEMSLFYFDNLPFWKQFQAPICKYAIQLNFKQKYQVIQQIGKGSFSKVYVVRNIENKKQFAAKVINKKDKNKTCTKSLVLQERKILRMINSQYVYKFQQLFEEDNTYVFIIEYLPGKDLMALYKQKKITQPNIAIYLLKQILQGIRDIHQANVIHRDLKPQNILVNLDTLKPSIIDFGLSLHLDETVTTKSYKRCGTMGYMAPEVIQNTGDHKKAYGFKCDIFSFGIISHMLLLGSNPLKGENYDETFMRNKACDIELDKSLINSRYGQHCFIFLNKVLAKYAQFRFDADQALKSQFLTEKQKFNEKDKQQSSSTIEQKKRILFNSVKQIK